MKREMSVTPCILNSWWDHDRWIWSVAVDGRWTSAAGLTFTKAGAFRAARRWHRRDERNQARRQAEAIVKEYRS